MADENKIGRPKLFKSAIEMQEKIDQYFKDCEGVPLTDKEGNPILNKWGIPVILGSKPPTVTGLALALGFNSRTTLLNYQDEEEFVDTITRAKSRVEEYAETRLFDKDGANGAKFSLSNNFKNWKERQEVESKNVNLNADISNLSDEELERELKAEARRILEGE